MSVHLQPHCLLVKGKKTGSGSQTTSCCAFPSLFVYVCDYSCLLGRKLESDESGCDEFLLSSFAYLHILPLSFLFVWLFSFHSLNAKANRLACMCVSLVRVSSAELYMAQLRKCQYGLFTKSVLFLLGKTSCD